MWLVKSTCYFDEWVRMRRIKLIVSYDGTAYCGWQIQINGNTIEGELNKCLSSLFEEEILVHGASRTDSGVHALCNEAIFDTSSRMPAERIAAALNVRLPEDIRIVQSMEVESNYQPRKQNTIKTYRYYIEVGTVINPLQRKYVHLLRYQLDEKNMQKAANYLIGEHDFKSFCNIRSSAETTVRTITNLQIFREDNLLVIEVAGTGFLYNMVRIIVGTLIEVGIGKTPASAMEQILQEKKREAAGPTAPAKGLLLYRYEHVGEKEEKTEKNFQEVTAIHKKVVDTQGHV